MKPSYGRNAIALRRQPLAFIEQRSGLISFLQGFVQPSSEIGEFRILRKLQIAARDEIFCVFEISGHQRALNLVDPARPRLISQIIFLFAAEAILLILEPRMLRIDFP